MISWLRSAVRNRVVVDLVILSMFIIALIISTTLYIRFGRSGALDVILVSSLASLFMVYRLYRDLGFQRARSLLAQFPQTLGPIQGRFIENRIEVQREHTQSVLLLDKATAAIARFQVLALSFDMTRWYWIFFPRSCFRNNDFATIETLIHPLIVAPRLTAADLDQRLADPSALYEVPPMPEGGVGYSGALHLGDLITTSMMMKFWLRPLIWTLVSAAAILLVGSVRGFGSLLAISFITIGSVYGVLLIILIIQTFQSRSKKDEVMMQVAGWIGEDGVARVSTIGGTYYGWKAFSTGLQYSDRLELLLPGKVRHVLICKRDHFANESDWQRANELISKHMALRSMKRT